MKAVILAAGRGRRLGSERPKCLLELGGRTLLERQVAYLRELQLEVAVVVGFEAEQVRHSLGQGVTYLENPRYREGSALSLACARPWAERGPVLVMDADLLYPRSFLERLLSSPQANCLLADPNFTDSGEEVKVYLRGERVVGLSKAQHRELPAWGESVGIFRFEPATRFWEALDAADPAAEYEPVLDGLLSELVLGCEPVHEPWVEIDFPADVERARREVLPSLG